MSVSQESAQEHQKRLNQLEKLYQHGILTEEEYEEACKKAIIVEGLVQESIKETRY